MNELNILPFLTSNFPSNLFIINSKLDKKEEVFLEITLKYSQEVKSLQKEKVIDWN